MGIRSLNYANRAKRQREQETYTRAFQLTAEYVDRLYLIREALKEKRAVYMTASEAVEMAIDALAVILIERKLPPQGLRLRPRIRVKATSRKAPDLFVNRDNPAQTWCGKGRQPRWFKEQQRQTRAALEDGARMRRAA